MKQWLVSGCYIQNHFCSKHYDIDDPGLIFVIHRATDVHYCLGRCTVSTVCPQLQQGRKCLLSIISYCFGTLLGVNELESVQNLYGWLDSIILRFCTDDVMVHRCDGMRMWGWYRGILGKAYTKTISQLPMTLRVWDDDCFAQRRSCGTMFQLAGAGEGVLTIEPMSMEPFFPKLYSYYVNNVQTIVHVHTHAHLSFTFNIAYTLHTLYINNVQTPFLDDDVIENSSRLHSLVVYGDVGILEKAGELLSNMHAFIYILHTIHAHDKVFTNCANYNIRALIVAMLKFMDPDNSLYLFESLIEPVYYLNRAIWTIATSSPNPMRYKEFCKNGAAKFYMPCWTLEELKSLGSYIYEDDEMINTIEDGYKRFGGIIHYVFPESEVFLQM